MIHYDLKFSELLDIVKYISSGVLIGSKGYRHRIKKYVNKIRNGKIWWSTKRGSQRQLNKIYFGKGSICFEYWHYLPNNKTYIKTCAYQKIKIIK